MSIYFETDQNELILCYEPDFGTEEFVKKLKNGEELLIKKTFLVNLSLLRDSIDRKYDSEETMRFCIGHVGQDYTQLDSEVIGTEHTFYFGNEIELNYKMFVAYRNISILRKIDKLIERDFYVGGNWEDSNGISKESFDYLLNKFPKTAELDNYAHKRIASTLKEYFPECDKYEEIYDNYILSKNNGVATKRPILSQFNVQIELEQFTIALDELNDYLERYEAIDEKEWQEIIQNIILILYPKYIHYAREIRFHGIDKYNKQPDYLLVDANGIIDILEIKKADVLLLTKYRNNYVASRELYGAIQQIEKYIYCLNSSDKAKDELSRKLSPDLPPDVNPIVVNPQGILILGRSNDFNVQQKKDFEIIKRQYKHVTDIMTYDDLAQRLLNIKLSLEHRKRIEKTNKD